MGEIRCLKFGNRHSAIGNGQLLFFLRENSFAIFATLMMMDAGFSRGPGMATRILLVDDEPVAADVMGRLLRRSGYEVQVTGSAAGAMAAADQSNFDLLITDILLPDCSGPQLMRDLTARHPMAGIAVSGMSKEDLPNEDVSVFSDYLEKPIAIEDLLSAIKQAIQ